MTFQTDSNSGWLCKLKGQQHPLPVVAWTSNSPYVQPGVMLGMKIRFVALEEIEAYQYVGIGEEWKDACFVANGGYQNLENRVG